MRPDVSVVIPTYNRRSMVQEAIESCFAGNDEVDVEVVVVDDGSTDGTRDYLESIDDKRVRSIVQEHQGAQVARNAAQQAANGRAIKHLDDDDYLLPGKLVKEFDRLREQKADVCFAPFYKWDVLRDEQWLFENSGRDNVRDDFYISLLSKSIDRLQLGILFDREAISGLEWDESLPYLQDVNFMVRAAGRGLSCTRLDSPVAVHRIHGGERISDLRNTAEKAHILQRKCEWYHQAYRKLQNEKQVRESHEKATAIALWREAHKLAPYDWKEAQRWLRLALDIYPELQPERSNRVFSLLDRLASPFTTERIVNPFRRLRLHVAEPMSLSG
jgi:glycosyltransferase involved in cell wall biosynthesis